MKLSEDDFKKINKHIAENWQPPVACPVCRQNNWSVSQEVLELREYHGGNMVIGNVAIVPITPVTCSNCGNTILFNPLIAGIKLNEGGI
jgi:predicted nucleic-acid-binding Zn-ribbon protein